MARGKKKVSLTRPKTPRIEKREALDALQSNPLLQKCGNEAQAAYGELVWAKATGYPYWPAVVSRAVPGEGEEETAVDDPGKFAMVMYLEPKFRLSAMPWYRVIPIVLDNFEEQTRLIIELNEIETKKMAPSQEKAFLVSCDLVKTFEPIPASDRNKFGEEKCREFKLQNSSNKIKKPKKVKPVSNESGGDLSSSQKADAEPEPAPRHSSKYTFRPSIKPSKVWDSSKVEAKRTSENSDEGSTASMPVVKKKSDRPVDGEALRDWTINRFSKMDKTFKFESLSTFVCSDLKCRGKLEDPAQISSCHEVPFHKACLVSCTIPASKDKAEETVELKCEDCAGQRCFVCHKGAKDEGSKHPTKCSKCDLRFHRECLIDHWPQAEIIGSVGQITCPLHYCHTCQWEHKFTGKVRNFKLTPAKAMRCTYCLSSYHKATCIPAGTGSTIMKTNLLICPRHTGKESVHAPKKIKMLGCFNCMKKLSKKDNVIKCTMCPLFFHLSCVYGEDQMRAGITAEVYRKDFKCEGCRWGVFPLYGQVVWYQQPASTYWPSLIMYPKDSLACNVRLDKNEPPGSFGVLYCGFGRNGLSYPSGRSYQTIPFDMASQEFLRKLNLFSHSKVESAEKEGFHLLKLSEDYRKSILPAPEPVYKHIDKNVMRIPANEIRTKPKPRGNLKEELEAEDDVCFCATPDGTDDVCTPGSSCFNRAIYIECTDKTCAGGTRCRNRMFTNKSDHMENLLQYFFSSASRGWGVKTTVKIPEDAFIIEYVGELISRAETAWREDRKTETDPVYFLEIDINTYIDAEYLGNMSRLINHSCDPNCKTQKYTNGAKKPVVGIFALRDIEVGEELTFDYNFGSKKLKSNRFKCRCKSSNCKGFIGQSKNDENLMPASEHQWDDDCATCGRGGLLLMCEWDGCSKSYHTLCVGLAKAPAGSWTCPDHGKWVKSAAAPSQNSEVIKKRKITKTITKLKRKGQNDVTPTDTRGSISHENPVANPLNVKATSSPVTLTDVEIAKQNHVPKAVTVKTAPSPLNKVDIQKQNGLAKPVNVKAASSPVAKVGVAKQNLHAKTVVANATSPPMNEVDSPKQNAVTKTALTKAVASPMAEVDIPKQDPMAETVNIKAGPSQLAEVDLPKQNGVVKAFPKATPAPVAKPEIPKQNGAAKVVNLKPKPSSLIFIGPPLNGAQKNLKTKPSLVPLDKYDQARNGSAVVSVSKQPSLKANTTATLAKFSDSIETESPSSNSTLKSRSVTLPRDVRKMKLELVPIQTSRIKSDLRNGSMPPPLEKTKSKASVVPVQVKNVTPNDVALDAKRKRLSQETNGPPMQLLKRSRRDGYATDTECLSSRGSRSSLKTAAKKPSLSPESSSSLVEHRFNLRARSVTPCSDRSSLKRSYAETDNESEEPANGFRRSARSKAAAREQRNRYSEKQAELKSSRSWTDPSMTPVPVLETRHNSRRATIASPMTTTTADPLGSKTKNGPTDAQFPAQFIQPVLPPPMMVISNPNLPYYVYQTHAFPHMYNLQF